MNGGAYRANTATACTSTKSLSGASGDPGVVSYSVRWWDILSHKHVNNPTLHVEGKFLQTKASIEWTGTNLKSGETVTARTRGQTIITAQLANMRNGVFFDHDSVTTSVTTA